MTRISDSGLSVAVVGATGQVGTVMREILAERSFPIRELRLFATARSAGTAVEFGGDGVRDDAAAATLEGEQLADDCFGGDPRPRPGRGGRGSRS